MTRPKLEAISPSFIVSNVEQTIAFYRDKLGFETRFLQPEKDPFFAVIGRDGAQIFIKAERDVAPVPNHTRHRHLRLDAFVTYPTPMRSPPNLPIRRSLQRTAQGHERRSPRLRDHRSDGYVLFFGRPR